MPIQFITTYCASSAQLDAVYYEVAYTVGRLMAERGIGIVNGAGSEGLMRFGADGCLDAGGKAIGIIPQNFIDRGWAYNRMTELRPVPNIHIRQEQLAAVGDAALVLPGGIGTLAELSEIIAWKQLGFYNKPLVILNTNGFFDSLLAFLSECEQKHFMPAGSAKHWCVAGTPQEAIEMILAQSV